MSYLADAHRDWHAVNGRYNSNCPLDCGIMSPEAQEAEDEWYYAQAMQDEADLAEHDYYSEV